MTPRRELVEPNAPLSMRWQCELLGVNRSSLYYEPVEPDGEQLALMRRMDELHLKHPFFGSRMMTQTLKAEGSAVNRKRVQRLMRLMGLESTAPKPNTSKPAPEHAVYPYLLRNLTVSRINQVWAADITYIPMARGFVYLVAVIDWYSRRVLAWRLSNTLETTWCLRYLLLVMCTHPCAKEALTLHLERSEGHQRYFGCNLMHRRVLASSHQHLMAEAPEFWYRTTTHRRLPTPERGSRTRGGYRLI